MFKALFFAIEFKSVVIKVFIEEIKNNANYFIKEYIKHIHKWPTQFKIIPLLFYNGIKIDSRASYSIYKKHQLETKLAN